MHAWGAAPTTRGACRRLSAWRGGRAGWARERDSRSWDEDPKTVRETRDEEPACSFHSREEARIWPSTRCCWCLLRLIVLVALGPLGSAISSVFVNVKNTLGHLVAMRLVGRHGRPADYIDRFVLALSDCHMSAEWVRDFWESDGAQDLAEYALLRSS